MVGRAGLFGVMSLVVVVFGPVNIRVACLGIVIFGSVDLGVAEFGIVNFCVVASQVHIGEVEIEGGTICMKTSEVESDHGSEDVCLDVAVMMGASALR